MHAWQSEDQPVRLKEQACLPNYRALLIVGHSEYWSKPMRNALEGAINKGVNLAVFGANTMGWQIRYEPRSSASTPLPQRIELL